ncbi:hypothetical protein KR222_008615 [Zaprionus bogoriensis]|nr:hypothetical protein KR222_008615 [Zaprionus bogoriensis]
MAHNPTDKDLEISTIVLLCLFVVVLVAILTIIIRHALRKRQQTEYVIEKSPVVVTSATHTAPGGYSATPIPATTFQPATYAAPYPPPPTGNVTMPMPMPGVAPPLPGVQPHVAPYPPMPMPPACADPTNMAPPSYDAAMANPNPSVMPGGYEKQMAYNPNYRQ